MFDQQEKEGIDVARRRKVSIRYYKKLMPTIYTDFFGLIGVYKKILSFLTLPPLVAAQVRTHSS